MDKDFLVYLDAFNRIVKTIMCQYEALIDGKWRAVIRYDCAHGQFHKDIMFPNGDKEKQVIEIESLNEAFNYALQDIKDKWQFYLDRYTSKIRS